MAKKGYFVIDKQGSGFKEGIIWKNIKELADSIREYPEYEEKEMGNLTHSEICELWQFEFHRLTPRNCERYGVFHLLRVSCLLGNNSSEFE